MNATAPPAGNLYLVVGYDGSPPAIRALDAAVRLMHGRTGSIEAVYVAHLPSIDMLSAGAVAEMEANFDDIARELHTVASEQMRGREERWRFERRQGLIPDELIDAAAGIRDAHPGAHRCPSWSCLRLPGSGFPARAGGPGQGEQRGTEGKPGVSAIGKPVNTRLPVMLATKTIAQPQDC